MSKCEAEAFLTRMDNSTDNDVRNLSVELREELRLDPEIGDAMNHIYVRLMSECNVDIPTVGDEAEFRNFLDSVETVQDLLDGIMTKYPYLVDQTQVNDIRFQTLLRYNSMKISSLKDLSLEDFLLQAKEDSRVFKYGAFSVDDPFSEENRKMVQFFIAKCKELFLASRPDLAD